MSITSKVEYQGALRTQPTHLASGNSMVTDAPIDNNGKGEAFSPTDMMATSLASCMLTVMGIKARSMDFDLEEVSAEVTKIMAANPRRVSKIVVSVSLKDNCDTKTKTLLEEIGRNCPVAKSLSSELIQDISFNWN